MSECELLATELYLNFVFYFIIVFIYLFLVFGSVDQTQNIVFVKQALSPGLSPEHLFLSTKFQSDKVLGKGCGFVVKHVFSMGKALAAVSGILLCSAPAPQDPDISISLSPYSSFVQGFAM